MSAINALVKRREKLERQIAARQRLGKRKGEFIALQGHGLLDLTDAQIVLRLRRDALRSVADDAQALGA